LIKPFLFYTISVTKTYVKRKNKKRKVMKTVKLLPLFVLLLFIVACTKNGNNPNAVAAVSTDDAADMVGSSLASNYNGLATVTDDVTNAGTSLTASSIATSHGSSFNSLNSNPNVVTTIDKKQLACGLVVSDTVTRSGGSNSVNYSYNSIYNFTLNCNNSVPSDMTSILAYNGSFSGPIWLLTDTGSTTFTVTGLAPQATDFVLSGEYKRHGTFKSKIDSTKHGYRVVDIVVTTLTLMKPSRTIVSGNATIAINGYTPKKGKFTYNGTLVFNNDGTANLTISGIVYNINLATGLKFRKDLQ
jgi:hypothetical protein